MYAVVSFSDRSPLGGKDKAIADRIPIDDQRPIFTVTNTNKSVSRCENLDNTLNLSD